MNKEQIVHKLPEDIYENSEQINRLTSEAEKILAKYTSSVSESYKEIGLTDDEVNEAIRELSDHIIKLSLYYAGNNNVATTDLVRKAIRKLGDPEIIKKTLLEEKEILEKTHIKKINRATIVTSEKPVDKYGIRVINIIRIYWIISWSITASLITSLYFFLESYNIGIYEESSHIIYEKGVGIFAVSQILFVLGLIYLYFIRQTENYSQNVLLRTKVDMNLHIFLYPIFALIIDNIYIGNYPDHRNTVLIYPLIGVLWIIMLTNKTDRSKYLNFNKNKKK